MSQSVAYDAGSAEEDLVSNSLYGITTEASMSQNVAYDGVKIERDADPEDNTYEVVDTVNPAYVSVEGHIDTETRKSMTQESMTQEIVESSKPGPGYSRLEPTTQPTGVKNPLLSARVENPDQVQRNRQYDVPSNIKTERYSHLEYH